MTKVKRVNPKLQKNKNETLENDLLKRTKKNFEITYLQTAIKPTYRHTTNKYVANQVGVCKD